MMAISLFNGTVAVNGHFSHGGNDFTIFADTTGADTNAIDLITSELAKLFVRPPEDFSGDVTVSTGVRSEKMALR